jgi:hypothetical protein
MVKSRRSSSSRRKSYRSRSSYRRRRSFRRRRPSFRYGLVNWETGRRKRGTSRAFRYRLAEPYAGCAIRTNEASCDVDPNCEWTGTACKNRSSEFGFAGPMNAPAAVMGGRRRVRRSYRRKSSGRRRSNRRSRH